MRQKFVKYNGITLISLVITIVVLIILAGISIVALTGEKGLISKVNEARKKSEESSSREKLELVLMNASTEKESNSSYNSDEYLTNMLENEGMTVNGDTILVDKYNFLIDREQLIILDGLGETTVNITKEVKEYLGKNANDKYEASILIKINSNVGISKISVEDNTGKIIEIDALGTQNEIGKDMTVELDKEYKIVVTSSDGKETVSKIIEKSEEKISTVDNLIAFRDNVNKGLTYEGKTITLTEDIDLSSICGKDIGNWTPIGNETSKFQGTFDGNNKTISNIYIDTTEYDQGLFGYIENSEVKNVNLDNGSVSTTRCAGGIVGRAYYSTISGCTNTVSVTGSELGAAGIYGYAASTKIIKVLNKGNIIGTHSTGGIAGFTRENSEITNAINTGNVTTNTSGAYHSMYIAGGIAGTTFNGGIINSCYNTGKIYGYQCTGGILGLAEEGGTSYISNCYSTGILSGSSRYAMIGSVYTSKGSLNNNYWLSGCGATSGSYSTGNTNAVPVSSETLKTYASVLGDAYQSDSSENPINGGYPILKWQIENE